MLVHDYLESACLKCPDKVALVYEGQRFAYAGIDQKARYLAAYLKQAGIRRGDRVVVFLDNSVESVIALFGILKAQGIFILLNSTMKAAKLNYVLRDSGALAVITHVNKRHVLERSLEPRSAVRHLIWCREEEQEKDFPIEPATFGLATSEGWDKVQELAANFVRGPGGIDIDIATIIYTSGSTGEPKGVVSTHLNMISAGRSITTYLQNTADDIILSALPLSFDYGLYQILMACMFAGRVVLERSFMYPFKIIELLEREEVTGFPLVPTMAAILLQMEDLRHQSFPALRYITNTAAALPPSHIRRLRQLFPRTRIYSMYGLTECKRVSYLPPEDLDQKPESVGIAIPNEEVFVVDASGEKLPPGEVGELVVRGANVMQGYWNAPEETKRVFHPGRYRGETLLYTGDLFRMDKEGYLYFVARKDDMIKTSGERVSPKEIETALCELKDVVEAAVIGVPDEILGMAVKACIVLKKGSRLDENRIRSFCLKHLEPVMIPKYIEFRDALPKSASGKIDKKVLKEIPAVAA